MRRRTFIRLAGGGALATSVLDLLAAINCPLRVLYADPAQPYFPDPLRHQRLAAVPHAQLEVLPGGHHLHMDQAEVVGGMLGPFLRD